MTAEELLAHATEFTFLPAGASTGDRDVSRFAIRVAYRADGLWAVTRDGEFWGPDGWAYEMSPSSRTPDFIARHRFPLEQAVAIAANLVDGLTINGRTWAQWQDKFAMAEAVGQ